MSNNTNASLLGTGTGFVASEKRINGLSRTNFPWQKGDAAWFAFNQDRGLYMRRAHPGEWPFEAELTIVRQVAPGLRERRPLLLTGPVPDGPLPNDDLLLAIFWRRIESAGETEEMVVPLAAIWAEWRMAKHLAGGRNDDQH